jgi:hypothetical protein
VTEKGVVRATNKADEAATDKADEPLRPHPYAGARDVYGGTNARRGWTTIWAPLPIGDRKGFLQRWGNRVALKRLVLRFSSCHVQTEFGRDMVVPYV